MAKRLIPSLNRVLIEKIIPPSTTSAGILLPEKTATKLIERSDVFVLFMLNSGKVVTVGPGHHDREGKLIPVSVKEGDTVLLPEYGGTEVKLGDKKSLVIHLSFKFAIQNTSATRRNHRSAIASLEKSEIRRRGTICFTMMISWERCMTDLMLLTLHGLLLLD